MPRGKASAAGASNGAKKPRGPKAQKLPDSFAHGTILTDLRKKEWKLGKEIGQGGFGLIYLANENGCAVESNAPYVVKIEPHSNGPLFCELHYYQRVAKADMIEAWKTQKKQKYLGSPKFIGTGSYMRDNVQFRFMVMERFGSDLQKLFEGSGKHFDTHTVYCLALRMIDALEYIHHNSYVHADIKASNILLGFRGGKQQPDEVYLVDYGLAVKYQIDGVHKAYKEDKRKAHDGTIEFTSTDAHLGVAPSRRGDMEILGFCLLQWLCSRLPWENNLANKDYVAGEKFKYTKNIASLMKACFPDGGVPDEVQKYFEMVKKLQYEECPNYEGMRTLFRKGLKSLGVKDEWKLDLPLSGPVSPKKAVKRKSTGPAVGGSKPKQKAVAKATYSVKQKESTPKRKTATPSRKTPGVQSPRAVTSPRAVASLRAVTSPRAAASPRAVTSPRGITPGRPRKSPITAATRMKSPVVINGGAKGDTPVKKAKTKRRVKRRKVATVDVSMQTSPP
ncbi:serine/threonine-protein kinase VRK1-like isoform X1 [Mizuhopecten yessoensis]|nr:serine/threonine-protein kinase VRK1-like isoform X1 [Mizuhopecten yessoensis]